MIFNENNLLIYFPVSHLQSAATDMTIFLFQKSVVLAALQENDLSEVHDDDDGDDRREDDGRRRKRQTFDQQPS